MMRYFVGDFETTVFEGQEFTEVWASACVELFTETVTVRNSINLFFSDIFRISDNCIIYFHNLKFDGTFILDFLLKNGFSQSVSSDFDLEKLSVSFVPKKMMPDKSLQYSITNRGQWYKIVVKFNGFVYEFRDSLKLLPFSVSKIGKSFGTKHKKLEIEYKGKRTAGGNITETEKKYIENDVLVVKEALEIMFKDGHNKLTIGSCCLAEFKKIYNEYGSSLRKGQTLYEKHFINLYDLPFREFNCTIGEFIRKSYRGGWCYLVKGKERKKFTKGLTLDVNSLYPAMMHSNSGNRYPLGKPIGTWAGNYIPDNITEKMFYYIRIKTRFKIKKNKLPFIQVKGNLMYSPTEMLETSDIYNSVDGRYYSYYIGLDDERHEAIVELTMTQMDYKLFLEHYDVSDFEILGGVYFYSFSGMFDEYIDKYKKIKMESTGAIREEAKLFSNNLYGKMSSSTDSSFKFCFLENDILRFIDIPQNEKEPGYIAVGSAITSYARCYTIRAAQKNFYGADKPGFCYSDTDSIHIDGLDLNDIRGVEIDGKVYGCWKAESKWREGWFIRQKTYIENVIAENGKIEDGCEKWDYCNEQLNIKCAGMPDKCKKLFENSVLGRYTDTKKLSLEELRFLYQNGKIKKRCIEDFDVGLTVPGKLLPKRYPGGIVLSETTYKMRG